MISQARPPAGAGASSWDRQRIADDPDLIHRLMASAHLNGEDAVPIRPVRTRRPAGIARQAALPPMLPPRLIHRDAAAAYAGISPNHFDRLIVEGLMPAPRRLSERRLAWDVRQLDAAIDFLPVDGEVANDATDDTSWADIDAKTQAKPSAR